jgi:hypothetical protein
LLGIYHIGEDLMFTKFLTPALTASLLFGVGLSSAKAANPQACVFDKYAPVAVQPYVAETAFDYGSYSYLGGAQLFVPAREGLTREWLMASVQHALAAAEASQADGTANCDTPNVKNVTVSVVSGGNGFWVQLISPDSKSSEALLKWARGVVDQHKAPAARR